MDGTYPFDEWADIYDDVYSYRTDDVEFYLQRALEIGGPILELGGGTGRVSLAIAQAQIQVVGVDISPLMVELAEQKADQLGIADFSEFFHGDMRSVQLNRKFPLVIMPFRSFQSMLTPEDQRIALLNARSHVAVGGSLIFDTFYPDLELLTDDEGTPFHVRDIPLNEDNKTLVVWGQNKWNHLQQLNECRLIIEIVDSQGLVLSKLFRDFVVRYTFRLEMEYLLELCGFDVESVFGDFQGADISEDGEDIIWIASRN